MFESSWWQIFLQKYLAYVNTFWHLGYAENITFN